MVYNQKRDLGEVEVKRDLVCWNCKEQFKTMDNYEFPYFTSYLHLCQDGTYTQVCIPKKKKGWLEMKERTAEINLNHNLNEYYNIMWKGEISYE